MRLSNFHPKRVKLKAGGKKQHATRRQSKAASKQPHGGFYGLRWFPYTNPKRD